MARTARAVNAITNAGLPTAGLYTAAAAAGTGETMPYGAGHNVLHVKNGSAAPITVTITEDTPQGSSVRPVVTVAATGDSFIFLQDSSGQLQGSGNVLIDYSLATTVTAAAFSVVPE